MIVPVLMGGLCNQLFIIAAGYALSLRYKDQFSINYNIPHHGIQGFNHLHYKETIYKNIPQTKHIPQNYYKAPCWAFSPIPYKEDMLIEGYFQSEKHFIDYKNEVRNLFHFPKEVIEEVDKWLSQIDGDKVSIHIRRGDYKGLKDIHPNIGSEYYQEAVKRIGKCSYIICTDDIDSVNKEMKFGESFIFSPFKNEIKDLYLLSRCDSSIICNSSFSWWGAYLGKEKKKVICPKNWFGPKGENNFEDIYVEGWERI